MISGPTGAYPCGLASIWRPLVKKLNDYGFEVIKSAEMSALATTLRRCFVVASIAILLVPAAGVGSTARPALVATDLTPLTLRGDRFKPGETVRLTVWDGEQKLVRVRKANAIGRIRAIFAEVQVVDRCSSNLRAVALGSNGRRATWKLPQLLSLRRRSLTERLR